MHLQSVNVGTIQPIKYAKQSGTTGIYKTPTADAVTITPLGLVGDAVVDTENHGGVDQAVYVFGAPDYAWWSAALAVDIAPGTFGENLTITELETAACNIGDRLHIGSSVILEVTAPRIPCVTLATRMGDPTFVKRFREGERPGLYCRVIVPGTVQTGNPVRFEPYQGATISAVEMFRWYYDPATSTNADRLRRLLAAPTAIRGRVELENQLAALSMSR